MYISKLSLRIVIFLVAQAAFAQETVTAVPVTAMPSEIVTACPTQVKPTIPSEALAASIDGKVIAQASIENGTMKEVWILSGPRVYHEAVRAAMLQYKCNDASNGTIVKQEFSFVFEKKMAVSCPQVPVPEIPRKALQLGIEGVVRAQVFIDDGEVKKVEILSGPSIFHDPVRNALLKYKCSKKLGQIVAIQEFNFRVSSQTPTFEYSMRITASDANLSEIGFSPLPLDKTFQQLSAQQRDQLRNSYKALGPEDEPPFPLAGLGELHKYFLVGAEKIGVAGPLSLRLKVDSFGKVISAEVVQTTNRDFGKFAASVAMLTPFKPAVCGGQPCDMDFIFTAQITRKIQ